jgi:beta-phosphoglucomutase
MHAIIFDMDGVLVLSGDAHFKAWHSVAAKAGIDLSYEAFTHTFGLTNPDVIRLVWKREVSAHDQAAIANAKEAMYRDLVRESPPLAPGLIPLLESFAQAGFVMGIGSSAPRENVDLLLDASGIRRFFAAISDGGMVKRGKPAPDVFLLAAQLAGANPARCAVIEDAPAGIQAAIAAGMVPVGVATTHDAGALRNAGATRVVGALADLSPNSIRELFPAH